MKFGEAHSFLVERSVRHSEVTSEAEWNNFRRGSEHKSWIYLIYWSRARFCWGTATMTSDRLRKSSLFNPKLTGKYDRRVDYLMLKIIHGNPRVFVFEVAGDPTIAEGALRRAFGQSHCYRGFDADTREAITRLIREEFERTTHYRSMRRPDQEAFALYFESIYLAKKWIPNRSGGRRTFHYGDSLEPKFLGRIGVAHLEPSIERVLRVKFF